MKDGISPIIFLSHGKMGMMGVSATPTEAQHAHFLGN